jgi:hypothetical protein
MAGQIKKPKGGGSKRLLAPEPTSKSSHHMRPRFSLENLSKSHCLSSCEVPEKAAFADRLHEMSQLTWQQIAQADRHGQGSETIDRDAIKASIPSCITEDVTIIAFRCIGMAPMVGYKVHDTFYVVWIDRQYNLYPH